MSVTINDEIQSPTESGSENSAAIFEKARALGRSLNLPFPGSISPQDAWSLVKSGAAILVDVRTAEELKFVGHVPDSKHVAWQTGPALIRNPRFIRELEQKASKPDAILFLCRSGKRSAAAAEAATKAGFTNVFNISEGFEGEKDDSQHRGDAGGWRHRGLPWIQD